MATFTRRMLPGAFRSADLVLMAVAFMLALITSGQQTSAGGLDAFFSARIKLSNGLLFAGFAVVWHTVFSVSGMYRSHRIGAHLSEWWEVTKAVVLGTSLLALCASVFELEAGNRVFLSTFFVAALVGTLAMRFGLRIVLGEARRSGRHLRNAIIVGCGPRGAALGRQIWNRPELGYLLLGYIDDMPAPGNPLHAGGDHLLGSINDLERLVREQNVDEVFVALPVKSHYETIARVIALGEQWGLIVRIPADLFEFSLAKARVNYLDDAPILTLETPRPGSLELALKRFIDVAVSAVALVALLPVFAVVALAVRLDAPGPVLFFQERIGLSGRRFRLMKFRTMVVDAEARLADLEAVNEVDGAAFKMKHDPRVTRVGRVLRVLSLDELPQLLSVLRGDMSLVGPRPLPVRDVERFDACWINRRASVKPGLTCLWQINGRHEIGFRHWMELDLQYIDHWSLRLDCEILARTIPAVLRGLGAS